MNVITCNSQKELRIVWASLEDGFLRMIWVATPLIGGSVGGRCYAR